MFGNFLIVYYYTLILNVFGDGRNVIMIIFAKWIAFAFTKYNCPKVFTFMNPFEFLKVLKLISWEVNLLDFVGVFEL